MKMNMFPQHVTNNPRDYMVSQLTRPQCTRFLPYKYECFYVVLKIENMSLSPILNIQN
jgi:hypothetical protein